MFLCRIADALRALCILFVSDNRDDDDAAGKRCLSEVLGKDCTGG